MSTVRNPWPRRVIGLVFAAVVFAADQGLKGWLVNGLQLREKGVIDLLPIFDFRFTQNPGVSLGLFTAGSPEGRWALVAMTAAIAGFVFIWLLREKRLFEIVALGGVLGGALGNIRDRFTLGYVVDYADLHFGEWRPFLIFNLADVAITLGVLFILARSLLSRDKPEDVAVDPAPES
ncbi:signal peptidase II [Novosphingobium sp. 9]|uniref:signal peptidase II n=1 Tax=Novosphingobium sp. 9 TaxID=2025349 RepID=UPI0021B62EE2|nr:signal peptidase II [Novosphingobium sp. 9]